MTLVGVECLADVREVHVISGGHSYFWQDFIVVKILLCSLETWGRRRGRTEFSVSRAFSL